MLGSLKYTQLSDQYPSPVNLRLSWLWKSGKYINHQVLITFQQNWFSQEIEKYALRYILTNSSWNAEELSQQCKGVKYRAYWQVMRKCLTVFEISNTLGTYWIRDCSITTWPQPAQLSDMASNDRVFWMINRELFYNIIPNVSTREEGQRILVIIINPWPWTEVQDHADLYTIMFVTLS